MKFSSSVRDDDLLSTLISFGDSHSFAIGPVFFDQSEQ